MTVTQSMTSTYFANTVKMNSHFQHAHKVIRNESVKLITCLFAAKLENPGTTVHVQVLKKSTSTDHPFLGHRRLVVL